MLAKVKVIRKDGFLDKDDLTKTHALGEVFEIRDEERLKDLVERKLVRIESILCGKKHEGNKIGVFVNGFYKIGGIETACLNLASSFPKRDIVFVVREVGFELATLLTKTHDLIFDDGERNYELDVAIFANYDVAPYFEDRIKARKFYQQIHADWESIKKNPAWRNFDWEPAPYIDKVVAVSETSQKSLKTALKKPIDSIVIPNILSTPKKSNFKIFLVLSRATKEKGFERVAKMIDRFEEAGMHFLFIIAAKGPELYRLQQSPYCVFVEPRIGNEQLIDQVNYLVQLSDGESYCYSVREALQRQVPVIATRVPELEKIIKEGENGWLVKLDLSDLDIKKIFGKPLSPKPYKEKMSPDWPKLLDGEI